MRASRCVRIGLLVGALFPFALQAQTVDSTRVIPRLIGIPPIYRPFMAPSLVAGGTAGSGAVFGVGVYKALLNPSVGALGIQAEGYFGTFAHQTYAGSLALGLRSPILALGGGLNLDLPGARVAPFVSFTHPFKRGGFIIRGSSLQATWVFGKAHHLRIGIAMPFAQPWVGRDRPFSQRLHLATPRAPQPAAPAAHDSLTLAVNDLRAWMIRTASVVLPSLDSMPPMGEWRANDIIDQYHATLDRVVASAGGSADTVRKVLLDSLLLPYDRMLGQKREPETLAPFAAGVLNALKPQGERTQWIASQMMAAMTDIAITERKRYHDDRLIWLPLQLALRNNEHETQEQVDSLIERATMHEFSDSNLVVYVPNEQFQWQLNRSIHDAKTYHVLWVHDFVGLNAQGKSDADAYRQVTFGYLSALLEHVRNYDRDGILPDYEIFFDEYYYDVYNSRFWMVLLNDPLNAHIKLRGRPASWQAKIDTLQAQLRDAVAHSQRLQQEASTHSSDWLRQRVSVHVHITQQPDPSFFGSDILPIIGMSDNAIHDHRKIAFYDVTENDPYRGALIVAGVGVGEDYAGSAWEDRAAILRGTAAQEAKREAARLLTRNGVSPNDLPFWLKAATDTLAPALRAPVPHFDPGAVTAMNIHNEVGYGDKPITVTKAIVYSLMPAGSVIKIANPLILNQLWGSLLLGHVLRGGNVLLMAPSVKNTVFLPPENSLMEEMLSSLLVARERLAPAIARAGGQLRVGMYNTDVPSDNVSARIDTMLATRQRTPWLRALEPFSKEVLDSLRSVAADLRKLAPSDTTTKHDPPKLHIKEDFAASADAWSNLFQQPGWGKALAAYMRAADAGAREAARFAEFDTINANTQLGTGAALLLRQEVAAKQSERDIFYLITGSFNADYRSAELDGEAMLVLSHFGAATGIGDFVLLPGLCTWVDTPDELRKYLPKNTGFAHFIAHAMRVLF